MTIANRDAQTLAELLAAVGEPTRIAILDALREGPCAVAPLAEKLQAVMVNVSHHLNVLRRAGLLTSQKSGRQVIYAINPEVLASTDGIVGRAEVGGWGVTLGEGAEAKPKRAASKVKAEAV